MNTYHENIGRWRTIDKHPRSVARDSAGTRWHDGNNALTTLLPQTRLGTGGAGFYLTMADFDEDGKQDVIARRSDGNRMLYRANGTGSITWARDASAPDGALSTASLTGLHRKPRVHHPAHPRQGHPLPLRPRGEGRTTH